MSLWLHSTILATSLAATVAVGIASASIYSNAALEPAAKADRLPLVVDGSRTYLTMEYRGDRTSVLERHTLN